MGALDDLHRAIGRLEGRVDQIIGRMDRFEKRYETHEHNSPPRSHSKLKSPELKAGGIAGSIVGLVEGLRVLFS